MLVKRQSQPGAGRRRWKDALVRSGEDALVRFEVPLPLSEGHTMVPFAPVALTEVRPV